MKKKINNPAYQKLLFLSSLLFLLFFITQCEQEEISAIPGEEEVSDPTSEINVENDSFLVSSKQAIELAIKFNNEQLALPSKSGDSDLKRKNQDLKITLENLKSISDKEENLFYVINYEDGNGWVIISADKRTIPILAYSEEGSFETKESLAGVDQWIGFAKKEVKEAKKQEKAEPEIKALWEKMEREDKGKNDPSQERSKSSNWTENCNPYSTPCPNNYSIATAAMTRELSTWGQGAGYNRYSPSRSCGPCERARAGCGPVAIAHLMRYYRQGNDLNFGIMPQAVNNTCNGLTIGEDQVARLMEFAGTGSNTHYKLTGCNTWTEPWDIDKAFQQAGYSNPGKLYDFRSNIQKIQISLRNGHPIIIMGTTCDTCLNPSHIWVLDGYRSNTYFDLDCSNGYPYCREYSYTYYSLNWGWGGNSNGWFGLSDFRTSNGEVYDKWLRVHMDVRP